jgi:hypothetical protein
VAQGGGNAEFEARKKSKIRWVWKRSWKQLKIKINKRLR